MVGNELLDGSVRRHYTGKHDLNFLVKLLYCLVVDQNEIDVHVTHECKLGVPYNRFHDLFCLFMLNLCKRLSEVLAKSLELPTKNPYFTIHNSTICLWIYWKWTFFATNIQIPFSSIYFAFYMIPGHFRVLLFLFLFRDVFMIELFLRKKQKLTTSLQIKSSLFDKAFKVTLMQIWKSANIFVFSWKWYVEDFTLKHLLPF